MTVSGAVLAASGATAAERHTRLEDLAKEAEVACVYHCDFGEPKRFDQMVTNIANHYEVYGADPFKLQIALVAQGPGVKFFLERLDDTPWKDEPPHAPEYERVVGLSKNGLKVYLCEITFARLKIPRTQARDAAFLKFVPSGVATVAALQSKGFAYIKTG